MKVYKVRYQLGREMIIEESIEVISCEPCLLGNKYIRLMDNNVVIFDDEYLTIHGSNFFLRHENIVDDYVHRAAYFRLGNIADIKKEINALIMYKYELNYCLNHVISIERNKLIDDII